MQLLLSMAFSVPASLIFIFLLPCFSISCTPTLPCNESIQIRPPFYLQSDSTEDPSCQSYYPIGCLNGMPYLLWRDLSLPLESISYQANSIRFQVPQFSSSLNKSGCGNLYFKFSTPLNNIYYTTYLSLNASFSSVRCYPPNQIQSPPEAEIFQKDYNLSYSPSLDENKKPPQNCSRPDNSDPTFEFILLFRNDSKNVSLLSASYSNDLVAQTGCFANSLEVLECEGCKG
jgi:signal recognition particle subunit SEC65